MLVKILSRPKKKKERKKGSTLERQDVAVGPFPHSGIPVIRNGLHLINDTCATVAERGLVRPKPLREPLCSRLRLNAMEWFQRISSRLPTFSSNVLQSFQRPDHQGTKVVSASGYLWFGLLRSRRRITPSPHSQDPTNALPDVRELGRRDWLTFLTVYPSPNREICPPHRDPMLAKRFWLGSSCKTTHLTLPRMAHKPPVVYGVHGLVILI